MNSMFLLTTPGQLQFILEEQGWCNDATSWTPNLDNVQSAFEADLNAQLIMSHSQRITLLLLISFLAQLVETKTFQQGGLEDMFYSSTT